VKDFLAVTGATTTGKTSLSVAVAEVLGGEIISMDSRQVYRGMDIATDKIRPPLLGTVPHHGLDLREPNQHYSAGMYGRDARNWIDEIRERGQVPMLVGGTGFFLKALIDPIFTEPSFDPDQKARLRAYLETQPIDRLRGWVRQLDPERAELAIQGGPHRLQRTLEVALLSGRTLTWWHQNASVDAPALTAVIVILELHREELDRRINERVDRMLEAGLLDEVRGLMAAGYGPGDPGMTGTGYRELRAHLLGEMPLDDALEAMRSQTRKYARRQITWFRHQTPKDALRLDASRPRDELVAAVVRAWREN